MSDLYRKHIGYQGEQIVKELYESHGYRCLEQNFTMRGGEIDLIMDHPQLLVFIEVKVVNYVDNLHDYITSKKMNALKHTIQTYLHLHPTSKAVRVDIVFVKDNQVIERFTGVEL